MKKSSFIAGVFVLTFTAQAFAGAWIPTYYRCTYDQLTPAQGKGRLAWADKYRGSNPYHITSPTGRDPSFLSNSSSRTIADSPDSPVIYPVYLDALGVTAWTAGPGGPTAAAAYASLPTDQYVNIDYTIKPKDVWNDGLCEAGCYTPNQKILFEDGETPIANAQQLGKTNLITLSADSMFGNLSLTANPVLHYTMDKQPMQQPILTFHMHSGGRLSVTTEHPLVNEQGMVRKAKLMAVGDHLVKQDGTPDEIVSIDEASWFGRVYNLKPVSTNLTENILVAQGYLNGSGRYQSEFLEELNRILLRDSVPTELIPGG